MSDTPLQKAIAVAGGQRALGRRIHVSQQRVWWWLNQMAGQVPAEFVIPIEQATSGKVSRHELRPDLYPLEGAA